jgi:class 3 adenylate cyclase/tetratricopeptide (TPR) repeat protein
VARQKLIHDRAGDRSIWFSITLDGCRGAPKQLDSETTRSTANANPAKSVDASIAGVRDAIARGELLQAFDLAERALEDFPANPVLQYNAVLALARAGATQQARGRYDRFKLGEIVRSQGDDLFLNDIAALDARIAKDEALEATGRRREARLVRAATLYEAIFKRTVDYYPGINAATLSLLSGQPREAESLARQVLKLCAGRAGANDYYALASEAEAHLVLGNPDAARTALSAAAEAAGRDYSAIATTRRQLRRVCEARSLPIDTLEPLSPPSVICYAGHLIGTRFPESREQEVSLQIAAALKREAVVFGYGSLASGADILFAEALLYRAAELNLVLPFELEEFKRVSVAPAGGRWLARFDACLKQAKSLTFATTDQYLGDESLFGYASRTAMGMARLRARFLDTTPRQIVVWDGAKVSPHASYGTGLDTTVWRKLGLPCEVISPDGEKKSTVIKASSHRSVQSPKRKTARREVRAMLFGDIKWFSHLNEAQLPIFTREVLGRFARVIGRHRRGVLYCNTWGDGLKVVTTDVESAARCAMELQEQMRSLDLARHGLPDYIALRLGGHVGPIYRMRDPVLKRMSFTGTHVTRAARIEPITPEGAVYVTEAFAAALTMMPQYEFACEYVGQISAPKDYGTMRLYSLRRLARS